MNNLNRNLLVSAAQLHSLHLSISFDLGYLHTFRLNLLLFSLLFMSFFTFLRDSINNSIMYTDIYIVIYIFISAILFAF